VQSGSLFFLLFNLEKLIAYTVKRSVECTNESFQSGGALLIFSKISSNQSYLLKLCKKLTKSGLFHCFEKKRPDSRKIDLIKMNVCSVGFVELIIKI
jgi:hypothetical protein